METPPLERKLAAILAADVEGYSRLMHADEQATLLTLTSHRAIVDTLVARGSGQISGTAGDSVLAEFASVVDAVTCAVAIQQELYRANAALPEERQMQFRIGINVGDVMVKDGDIFGDGVNVAARLESLAQAGGVCVTRGVRDHVRDRVSFEFQDLGEQAVKNIARPVRAYRVIFDLEGTTELSPNAISTSANGAVAADASEAPIAGSAAVELAFWDSVRDSDDPEMFEAYLAKYPDGEFRSLAEIRLRALKSDEARSAP